MWGRSPRSRKPDLQMLGCSPSCVWFPPGVHAFFRQKSTRQWLQSACKIDCLQTTLVGHLSGMQPGVKIYPENEDMSRRRRYIRQTKLYPGDPQ
jgi:hypothetical protein